MENSTFVLSHPKAALGARPAGLGGAVRVQLQSALDWLLSSAGDRPIQGISDHLLKDIGLNRADLLMARRPHQ